MTAKRLSRRIFLKGAGLAGLGLAVASCAPSTPSPTQAATAAAATTAPTQAPTAVPTAAPAKKVTVTIWGWWEERMQIFREAGNDFTKQNPNVEVVVEVFGDDLWPKVFASVPAGTGPTLCKMITTHYFKLRDQGLLIDLPTDVFPDLFLREKYPTHAWDAYGRFCMPEGGQTAVFTYNKKMFSEAGLDPEEPPRTWDDFYAAAEKLTVRDSQGVIQRAGIQFDDWLPVLNPLYQLGGTIVKREGDKLTANFKTPEMERAYQFFVDAAQKHQVWDREFPYYSDAIGNEQAAMAIGEAWVYGTWKNDFPDTFKNLGFAAPPTPTGEAKPYYGRQNSVLGLAVIKNRPPEETEAGLKFVEYLYKERLDTQFALANIAGLVPLRAELMADPKVTQDPFFNLGAELLPKEYDAGEVASSLADLITNVMNKILLEGQSVPEALDYGQTELQKLIEAGEIKYLR